MLSVRRTLGRAAGVTGALALVLAGCAVDRAPPTAPGASAASYRALGQEPGWLLTIDPSRMHLSWDYGEHTLSVPTPAPMESARTMSYRAADASHTLTVAIEHGLCHDTMSGMPYPDRVQVTIDGRRLSGCGGDPAQLLTDTEWLVEDISGHGMLDFAHVTLRFAADGEVAGLTGCNSWHASWRLTGEGLHIGATRTTRKQCVPALELQQQRFLAVLEHTYRFDIDAHGKLKLAGGPEHHLLASAQDPDR